MKKKFVNFLLKSGKLKNVRRTGWLREKMSDPETVAEHSWRLAVLSWFLGRELGVDENKLIKMALIHDLEEAVTGDVVIQRGGQQIGEKSFSDEKEIIKTILGDFEGREECLSLWEESHTGEHDLEKAGDTRILYQLGKIATCWQALEYELAGADPRKLDEFWVNAHAHCGHPSIVTLLKEMEELRVKEK